MNYDKYYVILPMELFLNDKYKVLSSNSKILYALFLNRKNFSKNNLKRFSDSNGIFIFYSYSQIQKHLCCSVHTAINTLTELEKAGLVRKEYQKKGLSLKIYVNDIYTGDKSTSVPVSDKPYFNSDYKQKPVTRQNTREEKKVSFDVEKAEKIANDGFLDFSEMKIKRRRTQNSGPTI